ncbi:MAG: hypothetical protein GF320_16480 [Armatimonadia bacterium]|nr:hypothetical protein [Armatimonadia bacterium]
MDEDKPSIAERLLRGRRRAESDLDRHVRSIEADFRQLHRLGRETDEDLSSPPSLRDLVARLGRRRGRAKEQGDQG